jgi:hypothetical protein
MSFVVPITIIFLICSENSIKISKTWGRYNFSYTTVNSEYSDNAWYWEG